MTRKEEIKDLIRVSNIAYNAGWTFGDVIRHVIDWAEEHPKNPWISVEDRLPELYQEVIVINNGKPIQTRRYHLPWWDEDKWKWSKALTKVTHWMPIPELPKGGES